MAVDHFGAVVGDMEHCLDIDIFSFDIELFENFEPEEMGDCDAEGFFQAVGGVDYELLVNGLDEFGNGLADFGRDDFKIDAIGGPDGDVLRAGRCGRGFSFVFSFGAWGCEIGPERIV